jgi:hypothetical protein
VATDQKTKSTLTELPVGSAIENELPTYRAISTRAVFSLVCGVLTLFSVASPYFFVFAILAVILGFTADRNVQRYPDMLTGRGLAKVGVALGLIFGLGIYTISTVQGVIRSRNAEAFARSYADVLKNKTMAELMWLEVPPIQRKGVTPSEVMKKFQSAKRQEATMYEMKSANLRALKSRLDLGDAVQIHFVRLENEWSEGLNLGAQALYEVHGPKSKDAAEEEYALVTFKGVQEEGKKGYGWYEEGVAYPYKPGTAAQPEKPVDDGHGHAH